MDERTFQRELVQLKLRVDDMAYQLSKAAADNDCDNDLRRHGHTHMAQDSRSHTGSAPPMPLSWSLVNSLRSERLRPEPRVSDLGQNVSLGPCTPPGSTTEAGESPRHDHGVSCELDASFDRAEQYCTTRCRDHESSARQRVAFRDKEISRLEELMRTTHERLRCSEEASIWKDHQLAELQGRLSHCENRLVSYSDSLAAKRADLSEAQGAGCRSEDVALQSWAPAYWNVQQSYVQDHMDQIVSTKNSEIFMLRMPCESNDAIVTHQEQAIAQSVMLTGSMHDELGRVSCELAALEINLANESKVSEEQGEVIAQLRASLKNALGPARLAQETASAPAVSDRACGITHSPLATLARTPRET